MPRISVVIPVYNGEKVISRCIESLLAQTIKDYEIIIVNDGSVDNTLNVVNKYASNDERIIVIDKYNEGVSIARNAALAIAKGEWIAFSDADDYYYPNGLQLLYETAIQNPAARIIIGNGDKIFPDGKIKHRHNYKKEEIRYEYPKCSFEMWGNLYHRSLIWDENHGFEPGLAYYEDRYLQSRMFAQEGKFAVCPQSVYAYLINEYSALSSKNGLRKARHSLWASRLIYDYSKVAPRFQKEIYDAYQFVLVRAFQHFVSSKNASFNDFKKLYLEYYKGKWLMYKIYTRESLRVVKKKIVETLKSS